MLAALQSQLELGDWETGLGDYRAVASHCLAPRLVPLIPADAIVLHHQSLSGMTPSEAKQAFLNLIQSWPLHRATIFDVMVRITVFLFQGLIYLVLILFSVHNSWVLDSSTDGL